MLLILIGSSTLSVMFIVKNLSLCAEFMYAQSLSQSLLRLVFDDEEELEGGGGSCIDDGTIGPIPITLSVIYVKSNSLSIVLLFLEYLLLCSVFWWLPFTRLLKVDVVDVSALSLLLLFDRQESRLVTTSLAICIAGVGR